MSHTLVHHFLEESARRLPDKVALVCDGERWTYGCLDAMANRLAHALRSMGVARGDRVAIHLGNRMEAVAAIFGILKAGAVFVLINRTAKRDKLLQILNNCRAAAVVADFTSPTTSFLQEDPAPVPSVLGGIACDCPPAESKSCGPRWRRFEALQEEEPADRPAVSNIDLDLACLIYTSGSTGEPKGVMCDHSNMSFAAESIISFLRNQEDDVVVNVLPLAFDYGLYQLLMVVRFGGTLVLERSFSYPAAVLKTMERERVTGFPGVPTMFAMLADMDLSAFDLCSIRYVTNTAAALPVNHIERIRKQFHGARLYSMYGLTETKRTLYLPPEQLDVRPGSVGIPIPGTEAWLEDERGRRLRPGETGELVVRGRHVMRGYWEAPEATAARYRPGSLPGERLCHTGDLFKTDEEGYFYFVARKDDVIKSRGEKVAPKEVESVLYQLEGVAEAAVIGVPDPILGQAVKAFLVVRDHALTEAQVMAHCKRHLEDFMVPKHVEFCASLPKTDSGKIKKTALT
jgi:amino acid adenylation domain-containing protein